MMGDLMNKLDNNNSEILKITHSLEKGTPDTAGNLIVDVLLSSDEGKCGRATFYGG